MASKMHHFGMNARRALAISVAILTLAGFFIPGSLIAQIQTGSRVECNWKGYGTYYPGVVDRRNGNSVFIKYDDGDEEQTTVSRCRLLTDPNDTDDSNDVNDTTTTTTTTTDDGRTGDFRTGSRVQCNWKGYGTYYPGEVSRISGGQLHIKYDDGDTEVTSPSMCRLSGSDTTSDETDDDTVVDTSDSDDEETGGQKNLNDYFREAAARLRTHPQMSELKIDPAVAGQYIRLEVGPRRDYSILLHMMEFASDGTGTLRRETHSMRRNGQLMIDADKTVALPFAWATELHRTGDGQPVTMLRLGFNDGSWFRFYYAYLNGQMGAILFNEQTQQPEGGFTMFFPFAEFQQNWPTNKRKLEEALEGAHAVDMQLFYRSIRMGNDNLQMIRTMNMGWNH